LPHDTTLAPRLLTWLFKFWGYGLDGWGSKPGGGEIFHTRSDRPWSPPSLLYNTYWASFPVAKLPRSGVDHTHPSSAHSGPSWFILG